MHFFVSVDVLRGGEKRPRQYLFGNRQCTSAGEFTVSLHSLSRQKGHELSDLLSDDR
jgi:hypothetical protein